MKTALFVGALSTAALLGGAAAWRAADHRTDRSEARRLAEFQPADPGRFDASRVADLPEPARRYFAFAIAPDTPLWTVAEISMTGQFALGDKDEPGYMAMTAQQTLAAPHGFVWSMRAARGAMRVSGFDSGQWTRFWAMGLIPVARIGGSRDHARSAFGRYVAEAVFWEAVDEDTARAIVTFDELSQSVDVTVGPDGRPTEVRFLRWTNANPEKEFRLQPFGAYPSAFREFGGFTLPTHVEAGNNFGTEQYFPFFIAEVHDVRFPVPERAP
jgi:hypothetical protein